MLLKSVGVGEEAVIDGSKACCAVEPDAYEHASKITMNTRSVNKKLQRTNTFVLHALLHRLAMEHKGLGNLRTGRTNQSETDKRTVRGIGPEYGANGPGILCSRGGVRVVFLGFVRQRERGC